MEAPFIAHPNELGDLDLSLALSSLSVETSGSASQTRTAKLALLQPLATPAMLAACRNPSSRVVRFPYGESLGSEILNIAALGKAWRQALLAVPPVTHLIFDLSFPVLQASGDDGSIQMNPPGDMPLRLSWDTAIAPLAVHWQHLAIRAADVMRLAVTIATTVRMRAPGDIHFEVVYNEEDGASQKAMDLLRKQLRAIAAASVSS
ncbi:hypothetical protein AURDEDRAFT_112174 [Auricularia subglabra TFB-10046 SS5]|nr:hypothetical protein AURDEDRAFT_112174 [Auricularia subglabra TFB-10046 SS5]